MVAYIKFPSVYYLPNFPHTTVGCASTCKVFCSKHNFIYFSHFWLENKKYKKNERLYYTGRNSHAEKSARILKRMTPTTWTSCGRAWKQKVKSSKCLVARSLLRSIVNYYTNMSLLFTNKLGTYTSYFCRFSESTEWRIILYNIRTIIYANTTLHEWLRSINNTVHVSF